MGTTSIEWTEKRTGARKGAALRLGISLEEYERNLDSGLRWCTACKEWHLSTEFGGDQNRPSGYNARCLASKRVRVRRQRLSHPGTRSERQAAVDAVRHAIKRGKLRPVRSEVCACGQPARHYHHHKGYAREHRLTVVPLCGSCHQKEHWAHG